MPACVENGFGHPQLRSMPATSGATTRAAASASAGDAEPSCTTRRPRSAAHVRKMSAASAGTSSS